MGIFSDILSELCNAMIEKDEEECIEENHYACNFSFDDDDIPNDDISYEEYCNLKDLQQEFRRDGTNLSLLEIQHLWEGLADGLRENENTQQVLFQALSDASDSILNGNVEDGLLMLRRLSKRGYAPAQYLLGNFYLKGKYVDANPFYAIYYLTNADAKGVDRATQLLAHCFEKGIGVRANPARAQFLLNKLNKN